MNPNGNTIPTITDAELAAWLAGDSDEATALAEPEIGRVELVEEDPSRLQDGDGGGNDGPPPAEPPTDLHFGGRGDLPERPRWQRRLAVLAVLIIGLVLSALVGWHVGGWTSKAMGVVDRGMMA